MMTVVLPTNLCLPQLAYTALQAGMVDAPLLPATPIPSLKPRENSSYCGHVRSLNPEFLEPAMQEVMGDLMSTLWGHLKPQNNPFGPRVLNLLGKMGGRNRRFLRSPAELEYKENPEHGLRLILTFQPSTSFLVPLDRSIALCRAAVNGTGTGWLFCITPLVSMVVML